MRPIAGFAQLGSKTLTSFITDATNIHSTDISDVDRCFAGICMTNCAPLVGGNM